MSSGVVRLHTSSGMVTGSVVRILSFSAQVCRFPIACTICAGQSLKTITQFNMQIQPYSITNNAVCPSEKSSKTDRVNRGRVISGSSVAMDFENENQKPFFRRGML